MHRVGLITFPDDSALDVMLLIEAFKAANAIAGRALYCWQEIDPIKQAERVDVDTVVVVSQHARADRVGSNLGPYLRHLTTRGRRIGCIGNGAFILARLGLLSGQQVALPWTSTDCFCELYPDIGVVDSCLIIDRTRFSCCGQVATADLAIRLIEADHGQNLATQTADSLCLDRVRSSQEPQGNLRRAGYKSLHPKLADAIAVMEEYLEDPVSLDWLAQSIELSPRQLQRLFRTHFQESPSAYYMRLRLKRARSLVEGTSMQISEVAMACGFVSLSHFSRRYRMEFNALPGQRHRSPPTEALPSIAAVELSVEPARAA